MGKGFEIGTLYTTGWFTLGLSIATALGICAL